LVQQPKPIEGVAVARGRRTPGVSCAAGRRVKGGGQRHETGARQCACGRPVERQGLPVAGDDWRLRVVVLPAGRSNFAG